MKWMSMGSCDHTHNWELRILDNVHMVLTRDGTVVHQTTFPFGDCQEHSLRLVSESVSPEQVEKILLDIKKAHDDEEE